MYHKNQTTFRLSFTCMMTFIVLAMITVTSYAKTTVHSQNERGVTRSRTYHSATYNTHHSATYNKDPLERFNRAMFTFNDKLDTYFMKPIAQLYNAIVPKPLNRGIHNVFVNLSEPVTIANDILQLNFYQMSKDTSRFVINSTMGIGGLFDMAERMHLPHFHNDFGLTLAYWGYKSSSYLVLPFLGTYTFRDGISIPVDYYGFSVYPQIDPFIRTRLLALFYVDYRANLLCFEPVLEEVAVDKYTFMRDAYMQRRAFQIEQLKHLGFKDRKKTFYKE